LKNKKEIEMSENKSNKDVGYLIDDEFGKTRVQVFIKRQPVRAAEIAQEFVTRWGMIAAKPDGEDSAGRAKLALLAPVEIVQRACDTAELLIAEFEKRGWFVELPEPKSKA
jgi:hypothetical protein